MGFWGESKENKEAKQRYREKQKQPKDTRDIWTQSADARNSMGDHGPLPSESYMCNSCWQVIGDDEDTITVRRKVYHLKCIK